jgi:hypothetical protein
MILELITNQLGRHRTQFFFGGSGGGMKPPKPAKPDPMPAPPVTYMPAPVPQSIPQASFVTAATPPPSVTTNADGSGDKTVAEEAKRKMSPETVGRQDTILTSGLGVTDAATTKKKTLLGGNS